VIVEVPQLPFRPRSIAMMGLGYSLWRTTRTEHNHATIGGQDRRGTKAVAE
jgi:hypothetical protein